MKIPDKIFFDKDSPFLKQMFNSDEYTKRQTDSDIEYSRSDLIQKWQPIETAPKDGTYVLLFYDGYIIMGGWNLQAVSEKYASWDFISPICTCCEGTRVDIEPTHWMPMSEPPNA